MGKTVILDNGTKINVVSESAFQYTVPVVASIAATISATRSITFDQDSVFIWTKTTYFVDLAAAAITDSTRPIPLVTVALLDTGSGRVLNSAATPIDAIAGYKASEPYLLSKPRQWTPNSTLQVTYTNYSAATTYTNLYMVLHGVKWYIA